MWTPSGILRSFNSFLILLIPEKDLSPEQLVTIKLSDARVEPTIDPLLPQEQAGFRHGKVAVNQVTLLTQDIEDSFSAKKKPGAVFVDFTAAYNTV